MKIGVLVNDVARERSSYTTVALMRAARRHAHRVFVIGVGDFVHEAEHIGAWAREAPDAGGSPEAFVEALRTSPIARVAVDELDVLLLRNNPYDDLEERPWAAQAGLVFGEEAKRRGVLVLNDPNGLAHALNKLYLESFPAALRPASVVTRHADDVREFAASHGTIVVKPLNGSGAAASSSSAPRTTRTSTRSSRRSAPTGTSWRRSTSPRRARATSGSSC
jgi:glutathione synthase